MKKIIIALSAFVLTFSSCKKENVVQPDIEIDDDGLSAERNMITDLETRHSRLESGDMKWDLDTNNLAPTAKYAVFFKSSFQPALAEVYTGDDEGKAQAHTAHERNAQSKIRNHFRPGLIDDQKISSWFTTLSSGFCAELTADEVKELMRDTVVKAISIPPVYTTAAGDAKFGRGTWPLFIHGSKTAASTTKRIWILDCGGDLDDPLLNVDKANSANFYMGSMVGSSYHGSAVSHIAASKIYGDSNVRGTAVNAKIVMIKVGSGMTIDWESLNKGLEYTWELSKKGDIVNLSCGTPVNGGPWTQACKTQVETNILRFKNWDMPVVIAAGNDGSYASYHSPAVLGLKYKDDVVGYNFLYVVANIMPTGDAASIKNRTTQFALHPTSNYGRAVRYALVGTWHVIDSYGTEDMDSGTSFSAPALCGILYHRSPSVSQPNTLTNVIRYKKDGNTYTHLIPTLF